MLKQLSYFLTVLGLMIVFFSTSNTFTYSAGSPSGFTGSPGDNLSTCVSCHAVNINESLIAELDTNKTNDHLVQFLLHPFQALYFEFANFLIYLNHYQQQLFPLDDI